ncbi:MAG TPA: alpha/beta fold hydrolase [Labilithrix sp.]
MTKLATLLALAVVACGSAASAPGDDPRTLRQPPLAQDDGDGTSDGTAPAPGGLGAPYPIVLMHGMSGFGKLNIGPISVTYFDGVAADLAEHGEQVFVTIVPPYDTSEDRAKALAPQIDRILAQTGKAKVNLVGHSQGGMDARVIASPMGLAYGDRIASVTTVATPHHGSRVADGVLGTLDGVPDSLIDDITSSILDLAEKTAFELDSDPHLRAQLVELSEKYMASTFNPRFVDDPRVKYESYAGRTNSRSGTGVCDGGVFANDPNATDVAQLPLGVTALFLENGKGVVNDGLVTVDSAKWGTFLKCVPADHLKEVGQLGPAADTFDHLAFFRDLVARVRANGF